MGLCMPKFWWSEYFVYSSWANPQKALAKIEAGIFKSKYLYRAHAISSSKKHCDIQLKSVFLTELCSH